MELRRTRWLDAGAMVLAAGVLMWGAPTPAFGQFPSAPASAPGLPQRTPLVVGLPVPQLNAAGELSVQPNIATAGWIAPARADGFIQPAAAQQEAEPLPSPGAGTVDLPIPGVMGRLLNSDPSDLFWGVEVPSVSWEDMPPHVVTPSGNPGLGRERVMYAPFEIDITQPFSNFLFRLDSAYHLTKPDRAEFFWSQPGKGPPLAERSVGYQDLHFRWEAGSDVFTVATDVPVRFVNPEVNGNNGGVGDIQLVQKTLMMNGSRWQMTQLLRTVFNNGNSRKGLGTGHVSMEPGVLCRYEWDELTFIHGQLKMMFPIGGDPAYSGPALTYGIGISRLYYETDTVAFIPTLEFIHMMILDGLVIPPGGGAPVDVKGDGILNLCPGLRVAMDTGGDLGIIELGISSNFAIGSNGWYDALLRVDLRFVF